MCLINQNVDHIYKEDKLYEIKIKFELSTKEQATEGD